MREAYMRAALDEAAAAKAEGEIPVGAVVVCNGEIIASAHNEREREIDPTAHAEVLALRRAAKRLGRRRLDGCTLYVTLEPCPMCAGAIVMAGVDAVYYGAADARAGCAGSVYALPEDPAFGKKIPCMGGMMAQRCTEILDGFFEERRT
ncbi:MAG: nucleoside deaminase [Clostridia bacterium]|nr:nucleoside deaminase [Clostridia bacterium]